ncbi:MAG: hypothetical protein H0W27_06640 [Actinobacteria bacterium]|nr:hypothetical protein [Actinomycetota bacterium]
MEIESSPEPAFGPDDPLARGFQQAVDRLRFGAEAMGERLLILDVEPPPVIGASGAAVGLDRQGVTVMLVALAELSDSAPDDLGDALTRMGALTEADLARLANILPEALRGMHSQRFGSANGAPPINFDQRVVLVLGEEPSQEWWRRLEVELGSRLDGVFVVRDGAAYRLRVLANASRPRGRAAALLGSKWGTAAAVGVAAALLAVALTGGFDRESRERLPIVEGFVSTVATGVPGDATHTQWTGQRHIVQTSDDRLHVLYASAGRLHVVSDHGNGGRTWDEQVAVPEIRSTGYAAAVDGEDRIVVAWTDDETLRLTTLTEGTSGWTVGEVLVLDEQAPSRVVDIAWDESSDVGHVVWAAGQEGGEHPRWAAVATTPALRVLQSADLAPRAPSGSVLITVAVAPGSEVVAAYRRGDRGGFFSRSAAVGGGPFTWAPEQMVSGQSTFGAVSLVADRRGDFHLALRDDLQPSLLYFRKSPGQGWDSGEVAVAAPTPAEVDFPVLSLDERSGLVFVFFQNAAVDPSPQIRVLVRDPVAGWQGSYQVVNPEGIPQGANFPIAAGTVTGSASVLWTRLGPIPQIEIARFLAP